MNMKQHGGEGTADYKGHKSDMKLGQHGGEGRHIAVKGDQGLLKCNADYRGPGFNLGSAK